TRSRLAALRTAQETKNGTPHVFLNYRGESLMGPREWFEGILKQAKVENFSWHGLRHTFASRLVMAGVDLRTVQELMGHKTIQMTMRYAHLAPAHKLAAVEKLAAGWQANRPTDTRTDTSTFEQASEIAKNAS